MGADPAIQLDGVTKVFGSRTALNDLSLRVQPGELFGFLGPNGAGKTTTIKILVGLLRPTSGRALICGHNVQSEPLVTKGLVGYVPDQAVFYDKLTGAEMVAFVADLYRVPRAIQVERIPALFERFDLSDRAADMVGSYSRGMRQKLGLCAALVHDPQVLFLDEPTVGLDPAGANRMKQTLRELCRDGKTVFLSTHVLEVAELLCDRVGIVQDGSLLALDAPEALRNSDDASLESAFLRMTATVAAEEV